jgi:hypothetical protein
MTQVVVGTLGTVKVTTEPFLSPAAIARNDTVGDWIREATSTDNLAGAHAKTTLVLAGIPDPILLVAMTDTTYGVDGGRPLNRQKSFVVTHEAPLGAVVTV